MPARTQEFHHGEVAMQTKLKVPPMMNPTAPGLPGSYALRVEHSPLVALGTVDDEGRPWTTVWGGERGFASQVAGNVLGLNSVVEKQWDPVFGALWGGSEATEVVKQERLMSALSFDPEIRDRVKLAGKMLAGAVAPDTHDEGGRVQVAMAVTESLGNCPKYINKKAIRPQGVDGASLESQGLPLSEEAVKLLGRADLFFMSSTDGQTMDTNNRGGPPGFVRVMKNESGGVELLYPECMLSPPLPSRREARC